MWDFFNFLFHFWFLEIPEHIPPQLYSSCCLCRKPRGCLIAMVTVVNGGVFYCDIVSGGCCHGPLTSPSPLPCPRFPKDYIHTQACFTPNTTNDKKNKNKSFHSYGKWNSAPEMLWHTAVRNIRVEALRRVQNFNSCNKSRPDITTGSDVCILL